MAISSMNWRVVAIISSMPAIMAAFDSSVPRMISRYFAMAFSSSGGAASRPSHPLVERAARGSTRPRGILPPRRDLMPGLVTKAAIIPVAGRKTGRAAKGGRKVMTNIRKAHT
ncbi:hypothetical protein GCM10010176_078680 [Nonomuraea spiralis]|nr:hypothetical protein GCM10010176_078680 [Nonomuraea spiralis]